MNINITRLNLIDTLFVDLIYDKLKYNLELQNQIFGLVIQIELNIHFLIKEYYFTNIIKFESVKKKLIYLCTILINIFIHMK